MCTTKNPGLIALITMTLLISTSCNKDEPVVDFVGFEDLDPGNSGYWNGSDGSGGFSSGNLYFINHFSDLYQSWSGFAYTNHRDTETADYANQYSAIAGSGAKNSEQYCVFYYSGVPDTLFFDQPEKVTSMEVCNSTYAYLSIRDGNAFCKKFGGDSSNDPDWFKLTLTGIDKDGNQVGVINIFLADMRFDNNSYDFIANTWTEIGLSELGYVKALVFEMSSSDSGDWGMNNPAYVCIDNISGELEK